MKDRSIEGSDTLTMPSGRSSQYQVHCNDLGMTGLAMVMPSRTRSVRPFKRVLNGDGTVWLTILLVPAMVCVGSGSEIR
jgi:hypothetical protein